MTLFTLFCIAALPFLLSVILGQYLRPMHGLVGLVFVVLALPVIWSATHGLIPPPGPGQPGWARGLEGSILGSRFAMGAIWLGAMATGFAIGIRTRQEKAEEEGRGA